MHNQAGAKDRDSKHALHSASSESVYICAGSAAVRREVSSLPGVACATGRSANIHQRSVGTKGPTKPSS